MIADQTSTIWARFYDLKTNQPILGDRDNSVHTKVSDISFERRNGYGWYGNWPQKLVEKEYPKWLETVGK